MKLKNILNKWLLVAIAGVLSLAFTSCESNDDNKTYIYTIGVDTFNYSGTSLTTPLEYLNSLGLSEGFTVSAKDLSTANAEAVTRFNTEMAKIDKTKIDAYGGTYTIIYQLYSVSDGQAIATKEFSSSQQ